VFERTGIKMKGIVAVQKKLLLTIYYLWKKNEPYDSNYRYRTSRKDDIQEEEQELSSRHGFCEAEKSSQTKRLATQGKHPVSDHSLLPLDKNESKKLINLG
jgi:transposase